MPNKFKSASHCVYNLKYHIVFVVAYRRKAITGEILTALKATFSEVCSSLNAELIEFSGETDHVHLLVSVPPSLSISRLVATLKSVSSQRIRKQFWNQIKRKLWGSRFWTRSYCVLTVGDGATTDIIKRYIENQLRPS